MHSHLSDSPVYVIGHRNPDTDAICSAIGYADLLAQTRIPNARPARCGSITARTEWVLKAAGAEAPERVMDVRQRVGGICRRDVITARSNDTFHEVYARILSSGLRGLPVVDEDGCITGMLQLLDLLALLFPPLSHEDAMRTVRTSLCNVKNTLGGKIMTEASGIDANEDSDFVVMIAASSEKVMAERIDRLAGSPLILLTGDRPSVQHLAAAKGVRCLVVSGGFEVADDILELARENGVNVYSCEKDSASTSQLIRGSRSVTDAISRDFVSFAPNIPVEQAREQVVSSTQVIFPVIDPVSNRLLGAFSKTDLIDPPRQKLVLVDHNEFSQAVAGADEAEILEVVDHHRLSGNLISHEPIRFVNIPVGSTSTIVGRSYRDLGLSPSASIATCLCAGIISDTLKLTSPTTTDEDRQILNWLADLADLDIDAFAEGFFAEGSALLTLSTADALSSDRKEFEQSGYRLSISQIEEVGLNNFWPKRDELRAELQKLVHDGSVDVACLMVTDVGRHFSILLIEGPAAVIDLVDFPETRTPGSFAMDGVVSRKKQVFPWISRLLAGVPK